MQDAAGVAAGQDRRRPLGAARAGRVALDIAPDGVLEGSAERGHATGSRSAAIRARLAMSLTRAVTIDASWPESSRSTQTLRRPELARRHHVVPPAHRGVDPVRAARPR